MATENLLNNDMTENTMQTKRDPNQDQDLVILMSKDSISVLCKNPNAAASVYEAMASTGLNKEDINLAMSEETHQAYFPDKGVSTSTMSLGSKSLEGMGVGSAIGGAIGALGAAVAALGSELVIPALGVVVAGSWAAGLAGAGAGSATGGLIGALVGLGIADDQAKLLEDGINNGGIVISIKVPSDDTRENLYSKLQTIQNKGSVTRVA